MAFISKSSLIFNILALSAFTLSAHAVEKFAATVEDGTAKVLRANSDADVTPTREEFLSDEVNVTVRKTPVQAPARLSARVRPVAAEASPDATTAISAEVAELKHQNEELRNRLNALEASTKAAPVAVVAAPALPPASAPVVAPMEPKTLNTNMKATVAAPADVLESRLSEKVSVSKELAASKVTAQKQATRFDAVPDQHITEIAQRLKYANEILKRFGRAYDYRATTLREFKHVLAELEDAEEKQKDIN